MAETLEGTQSLESTTVGIYRTASVIQGGRRFSFAALVVVGDRRGKAGIGYGKAPGVPAAIEKAQKDARKQLMPITLEEGTISHPVTGRFRASKVRLIPAAPGTGVIAGGTVRAVLEMAGVHDCLTKAFGSTNKKNLAKAVMQGLQQLRPKGEVERLRRVEIGQTEVQQKIENARRFMAETAGGEAESRPGGHGQESGGTGRGLAASEAADQQTKGEAADPGEAGEAVTQRETERPQAEAAPSSPEHTDTLKPEPENVDTPKESTSGPSTVKSPKPEDPEYQPGASSPDADHPDSQNAG